MKIAIEKIESMPNFRMIGGTTIDKITAAENLLRVKFAIDYRAYLEKFGAASFFGHEMTGICDSKRLNVVDVTKEEREYNPDVPNNLYVVEQANIDGIVIWQSAKGEVYQSIPGHQIIKIADSLVEYIDNFS